MFIDSYTANVYGTYRVKTYRGAGASRPPLCVCSICEVCTYMCSINVCRVYMCCIYACTAHILVARTCVAWTCSSGVQICRKASDFSNMCQILAICVRILQYVSDFDNLGQIFTICVRFCLKFCLDGLKINPGEYQNRVQRPRKPPVGFVFKGFWKNMIFDILGPKTLILG